MYRILSSTEFWLRKLFSEDMINLLGKRPFIGRSDDMDKWLDENRGEKSAPPPLEAPAPSDVDAPMPALTTRSLDRTIEDTRIL